MKAAIYARVSTADQKCDLQIPELHGYAKRQRWDIVESYEDVISGAKASRPGLNRLMADAMAKGKASRSCCAVHWAVGWAVTFEMHDPPSVVCQNEEHVQDLEIASSARSRNRPRPGHPGFKVVENINKLMDFQVSRLFFLDSRGELVENIVFMACVNSELLTYPCRNLSGLITWDSPQLQIAGEDPYLENGFPLC